MTIQVGDRLPDATFKQMTKDGPANVSVSELTAGKSVVIFSVPGAFTPTCHAKHLPGFVTHADALKGKGVDAIACTAVNDVFVMKAWGNAVKAAGKVSMIADGNGAFIDALGLAWDASVAQLGKRGRRFAMLVKDGKVSRGWLGVITGDIPAISEGALRLATTLAGLLWAEDIDHHFARMQDFAEPEVFGDEWVVTPLSDFQAPNQ